MFPRNRVVSAQDFHEILKITQRRFRWQIFLTFFLIPNTSHYWSRLANTKAVIMRISCGASFKARHSQERMLCGMPYDLGHNHTHQQFRSHRHHLRNEVGTISYKLKSLLLVTGNGFVNRYISKLASNIHALNIICILILTIHGPPLRRITSQANGVLYPCVLLDIRFCVRALLSRTTFGVHPGRHPRQILHGGIKLLTFISPLHRRRSHLPTDRRQLPNQNARFILFLQNLSQPAFCHYTRALETQTRTTHNCTINTVTALTCL